MDDNDTIELLASDYAIDCNFSVLKVPNIEHIIEVRLSTHSDWIGYKRKLGEVKDADKAILHTNLWSKFAEKVVMGIKACIDPSITEATSKLARTNV